ncbi:MAG: TIGR02281 family clan AA aspartic protease [Sphingomonadales bacterium]|nr:MAG: TIGR02281 family clan AA aspartic protease [Sphingomonadales bacterium]TNF05308.1 MAG: TIGR02281 family clan AA aspartic protease [Sphingomonadales bacterium]
MFRAKLLLAGLAIAAMVPPTEPAYQPAPLPVAAAVQVDAVNAGAAVAPSAVLANVTVISRSADGLFYVDAKIGQDKVRFLVDTGANVTVLTGADAARLGLSEIASRRGNVMQTVGGPAQMRWAKIERLDIANNSIANVEAAVVDNGIPVSLLGQNVLSRLDGMTFAGDTLQIH